MNWKEVLNEMGFNPVEPGSNIFINPNLGDFEFDFTSRQSIDSLAACIWDVAQEYGEQNMKNHIINNLVK